MCRAWKHSSPRRPCERRDSSQVFANSRWAFPSWKAHPPVAPVEHVSHCLSSQRAVQTSGVAPTAAGLGGASDAKGALIIHAVVAREHAAARVAVTGPGATRSAVGGAGDVCQGSVGIYAADEEYDREGSGQASPGQAQRGSFGAGKDHRCSPAPPPSDRHSRYNRCGRSLEMRNMRGKLEHILEGRGVREGSLTKRRAGETEEADANRF